MPVVGADLVAKNIIKFGGGFIKHTHRVMDHASRLLDTEITANMSLSEHTQEDLDRLDHPYAKRHGSHGRPIHEPYWLIHQQTGLLLSSKKRGVSGVDIGSMNMRVSAWVGLDENITFYANYVIFGTSKMIPRDVLSGSLFESNFQIRVKEHLKRNLRDMVINFRGTETKI